MNPLSHRLRTAVLISGNGSNLQALIDAARQPAFPAVISLVISNRADAYGILRATDAGIPVRVIDRAQHATPAAFDLALHEALSAAGIELVCLAGFMRILTPGFVAQWRGRLMNIHPSLLPSYKGLNTHARVLAAGEAQHGATVHWVSEELDAGEMIAQESLAVEAGETPQSLARRVQEIEHRIYPAALRRVAETRIAATGERGSA
jgi:phosphoribosylglycinamide formyltransferase-1